jgi:hypothetical protein
MRDEELQDGPRHVQALTGENETDGEFGHCNLDHFG